MQSSDFLFTSTMSPLEPVSGVVETSLPTDSGDEASDVSIDAIKATTPEIVVVTNDAATVDDPRSSDSVSTADDATTGDEEDKFAHVDNTIVRKSNFSESTRLSQETNDVEDSKTDTDDAVPILEADNENSNTSRTSDDGSTEDLQHLPVPDASYAKSLDQTDSDSDFGTASTISHSHQHQANGEDPAGEGPATNGHTTDEAITIVSFHSDAEDLYLPVQDCGVPILYHVLAANFASASPTWRQIIYAGKYPRPDTGKWVIEMLDDDSYGLGVLLSVVHYQFDTIPERPSIDELYRIALVADKYKCVHLLRPYFKSWLDKLHRQLVLTDSHTGEDNKVLYLTWTVGDLRWFPRILHRIIQQTTVARDGSLLDSQGQKWDASPLPQQIIDQIRHIRQQKIDQILAAVKAPVDNLLHGVNTGGDAYCRVNAPEEKTKCEHAQLGSLLQGLCIAGLYPFERSQPYTGSVEDLVRTITSIKLTRMIAQGMRPHQDPHSGCSPGYKALITTYQAQLPELTAYALLHLTKQAKASGVYSSLAAYFDNLQVEDKLADGDAGNTLAADDLELHESLLEKRRKVSLSSTASLSQADVSRASFQG